ncbi:MAG: adenylate/guanylate cyclase domain-containing protein [Pseudomonadota bacterium]
MASKPCIPITAISVFGTSALLAVSVGIVLYLGITQATKSTVQLWAEQSNTLIDAMESSIEFQLAPVRQQAEWVAQDIHAVSDLEALDEYIYGVMSATPQVVGIGIFTPDAKSRQWARAERAATNLDWSDRPEIVEWLATVESQNQAAWRPPIGVDGAIRRVTLLHDIPLHNEAGEFIGVFAQIVPISDLSLLISRDYANTGITPFVLYEKEYVLAHPLLITETLTTGDMSENPLPTIESLGDIILTRIWDPDDEDVAIEDGLTDSNASVALWGDVPYVYIHRDLNQYGPDPWTIGAYINTELITDEETERLQRALIAALAVLVIAVVVALVIGRRISKPIVAIADAAAQVEAGHLDNVPSLKGSSIRELDGASSAFNNMVKGLAERALIFNTLGRFVPEEIANSLLAGGGDIEPVETEATILFCDIAAFTTLTESLGPARTVEVLNAYFSAMVDILEHHRGVVTQFQGDAILATFNVPVPSERHADEALQAAYAMLACVKDTQFAGQALDIRIGINSGPVLAGAIGAEGRLNYTVHGDAVNRAARLEALNKQHGTRLMVAGETVTQLSEHNLVAVGETAVRGQTQSISLYTDAVPG